MNTEKKIEKRTSDIESYDSEKGVVSGYAAVFDTPSINLGFSEIIERGAITEDTIKASDVYAVIDHNRFNGVLARSRYGEGSLRLTLDEKGLKYEFALPETNAGNELRSYLDRGEITSSSFAFTVVSDEWSNSDGTFVRKVKSIDRIFDVSPVFEAAYEGTEVALRSLENFKSITNYELQITKTPDASKTLRGIRQMRLRNRGR
jgi:HK97 family phage prohead protease